MMNRRTLLLSAAIAPWAGLAKPLPEATCDALAEIGGAALSEGVVPADSAALRAELGLGLKDTLSDIIGELNERVASDFASGEILYVAGWMLSRTEVIICALVALDGQVVS